MSAIKSSVQPLYDELKGVNAKAAGRFLKSASREGLSDAKLAKVVNRVKDKYFEDVVRVVQKTQIVKRFAKNGKEGKKTYAELVTNNFEVRKSDVPQGMTLQQYIEQVKDENMNALFDDYTYEVIESKTLPALEFHVDLLKGKTSTFASTAIPKVRITPAIPGRVSTVPNMPMAPKRRSRFTSNAMLATTPLKR